MAAEIPVYLPDGAKLTMTSGQLYDYYRLQILSANYNNVPKFKRAVAGVAKARAQGDIAPEKCNYLDQLAARKRREIEADGA